MSNTITVNLENLKPDERKRLLALVEKANKPKSRLWKPEEGENIYYLAPRGSILSKKYVNTVDEWLCLIGNCFKTKKEAEFARERLEVLQQMKEIAAEEEFGDNKYYICYGHLGLNIYSNSRKFYCNDIYFPTRELAQKAISKIGADKIKKYYSQVPDTK